MYGRSNNQRQPMGMGGGTPPPKDLMILIAVLFFTFALQFFQLTSIVPGLMQLSPAVWQLGFLWQLGTYAFAGHGAPSLWFLMSLLMIFWFGRDVCRAMSRKQFWILMAWGVGSASVVAVLTHILMYFVGGPGAQTPFGLMQGQNIVLAILTAAFATLYGHATILLMFVFPVPAKYFIGLEILFAFMAFLGGSPDKDLPGFLGICAAVAVTYSMLSGRGAGKILRQWRLQIERMVLEARLKRSRRGMRVVKGKHSPESGAKGKDGNGGSSKGNGSVHKGPWIH
jgi:hypothetical protein